MSSGIDSKIKERASLAIRYSPFNSRFYSDANKYGLTSKFVFENENLYCGKGLKWFNKSNEVEDTFRWFIRVGILRREVDGQGLTSSIRMTPIGRNILETFPELPHKKLNFLPKLRQWFLRRQLLFK